MSDLIINLPEPHVIAVVTGSHVEVTRIIEDYSSKYVIAICNQPFDRITLWSGAEYDAIGQWTDDDVIARIQEIYTKPTP